MENTEEAIKNGHSRETGNIGCTKGGKTQHNICGKPLLANKHKLDYVPLNIVLKFSTFDIL